MVKLIDILNENILRYPIPDQIFEDIKTFGLYKPVLYRGMVGMGQTNRGVWDKVENNRPQFRGSEKSGSMEVLSRLGIDRPVFATRSPVHATIFGSVGIVVPIGKCDLWVSNVVFDLGAQNTQIKQDYMKKNNPDLAKASPGLLSTGLDMGKEQELIDAWWKDNIDDVVKSYKKITYIPDSNKVGEIIMDVDSYWIVNPTLLHKRGGKYMPTGEIKNYKDLMYKISAFNRYQNLKTKG